MNGYFSYYYLSNYYYIILVLPMVIFSMIASARVNSSFKKYSKVMSSRRITGAQAAFEVLRHYGITNVQIERVSGNLTDHYDPRSNVIRLSDNVYSSTSVAAIGVACHEAGHAAQYAQSYAPIKIRNKILPLANIGSKAGIPLAFLGYFLNFEPLALAGVVFFAFAVIFQLVTLPVEFNASKRAIKSLKDSYMLTDEELPMAKKVLSAAALTYVAALAVSLAQLLRLLALVSGGRRRR